MLDDEQPTTTPAHRPARNPGSQSALRSRNQQRITQQLLKGGPSTQAELARSTGLSTATISNIVKSMAAAELVTLTPVTSSGRRAMSVRYNGDSAIAAGIDFGRTHVRVVLANTGYHVLAEEEAPLPRGHEAAEGIQTASRLLDKLLRKAGISRSQLIGAGAGIPGPIDSRSGKVIRGAILPEWVGINLHSELQKALEIPVFVDNDANLGALAQLTWGDMGNALNLMFIKIGTGIGSGLILGGHLFHGSFGVTGEIGHVTIDEHGMICRCGNRGCLETVASTATMVELLSRGSEHPISTADILRQADAGDPATLRVLDDAGMAIGRALANVANLISPDVIVIGGPLTELGELFLAPIRRGLLRHAVPIIGESIGLKMSQLTSRAEALGAAALVFQNEPSSIIS
ncbi:ROK family transcriptional regulator [Arthrobacter psychrolactophilus]|uniref:ROK family transcriptional regulator n=1 Tax=Arthrobacter psychrolactophilus TaxID=92442 RepID=A0A2V5IX52_9MICC|nr:ROK family transcriptional regulator [Arthrobacter psychrolactophilus]PYI38844.1 ROK family transcriptional regulator [Arthrobacter psychrolactophilus]